MYCHETDEFCRRQVQGVVPWVAASKLFLQAPPRYANQFIRPCTQLTSGGKSIFS